MPNELVHGRNDLAKAPQPIDGSHTSIVWMRRVCHSLSPNAHDLLSAALFQPTPTPRKQPATPKQCYAHKRHPGAGQLVEADANDYPYDQQYKTAELYVF